MFPRSGHRDWKHFSHSACKLLQNVPLQPLFNSTPKLHENGPPSFFSFIELLHSRISPRRFYRIVPFNEALEKLIFPSVASLVPIQLIKLHGIFNLAL